jgi:hypothetical protein
MINDKTNFEMSVENALGLPSSPPMIQPLAPIEVDPNADIDDDFAKVRNNLHQIIHKGNDALEEALMVAKTSEHPRAFEVVGQLIKTMVDANKDLLDIQKKLKELKKSDDPRAPTQNIQAENAIVVGPSAELQALINGRQ